MCTTPVAIALPARCRSGGGTTPRCTCAVQSKALTPGQRQWRRRTLLWTTASMFRCRVRNDWYMKNKMHTFSHDGLGLVKLMFVFQALSVEKKKARKTGEEKKKDRHDNVLVRGTITLCLRPLCVNVNARRWAKNRFFKYQPVSNDFF